MDPPLVLVRVSLDYYTCGIHSRLSTRRVPVITGRLFDIYLPHWLIERCAKDATPSSLLVKK